MKENKEVAEATLWSLCVFVPVIFGLILYKIENKIIKKNDGKSENAIQFISALVYVTCMIAFITFIALKCPRYF